MDVISVIVPVYMVEEYLERCVSSIAKQTYPHLEIILVDDGSPDHCPAICDRWAEADGRIKVIHQENGGVSSARNAGLREAKGEYIAFVDGDDFLPENALQILYERIIKDGSDMVIGKHTDIYENGSENGNYCRWMTDGVLSKEEFFRVMGQARHFPVTAYGKLYKKQVFEGLEYPPITYGEDLWLFPLLADRCEIISSVGETVYFYYRRNTAISYNKSEQTRSEEMTAILHMAKYLQTQGCADGAAEWVRIAVDKAAEMQCRREGIGMIKEWFEASERRRLLNGCSLKTKLKWLTLHIPVVYDTVRFFKRMIRRSSDGSH